MGKADDRHFGDIADVHVGAVFASRAELAQARVHRPLVAGISGSGAEGADSIVLSGGYEDDEDYGDLIVYTGHGGNDLGH
jgi:putative restriction endonuclease